MKNIRFLLTLLAVFLICASIAFVSCNDAGEETTELPDSSSEVSDAPGGDETTVSPEGTDEPTKAPEATDEPTAEVTTKPTPDNTTEEITTEETTAEITTEAPEVTTEAPEVTTEAPEETTEPPHVHSFGAWNTVKTATCTEEGISERTCVCGEKETAPIAKTEHYGDTWIYDKHPSCTEDGSRHIECLVCKAILSTETLPALGHVEGDWIIDAAPTCTESGSQHIECSVCKATVKTEAIPATGHIDGSWIIDKEATANETGSKHLECAKCKVTLKTEVIPATPHVPGEWIVSKEPTCTETGSRYRTCINCGETVDTEVISAKGHVEVVDEGKSATCTLTGLTSGIHCSVCNTVIKAQEVIPAIGHVEMYIPAVIPTCTETGLTEGKYCSVCNSTLISQETVPAKGHMSAIDPAKDATCTETGLTEGAHCSVCKVVLTAQDTVPAKGHVSAIDPAKDATCTETGLTEGSRCSVCNVVLTAQEIVPAKGHQSVNDPAKDATCTETGLTAGSHCSVCNEVLTAQEIVPAKGHQSVTEPAKDATCTETGLTAGSHCSVCNQVLSAQEIVPAKGHQSVTDPAKDATCTETGLTSGAHCSVCNVVLTAQEIVPAKGHQSVNDPAKDATCTETGLTAGSHCSVCNTVLTAQEETPAKGHTEIEIPAKPATCTESGLTAGKKCSVCNAVTVSQKKVLAKGHQDGEWIIDKQPTLTETGSKHQVCLICGITIKTETIPVLEPEKIEYTVTILDGYGNPVSGIKVSFMSAGKVVAEDKTDATGKAVVSLAEGDYEAIPEPTSGSYSADSVKLTASAPSGKIMVISKASNPIYDYPDDVNGVYVVSVGSVIVPVKKDEMRYFFFEPKEGAYYRVYTDSAKVEVGYYGMRMFVSETNSGTMLDNGVMELKVLRTSVGIVLVIGLKSTSSAVDECTLTIEKYADIDIQIEELDYQQYQLSGTPQKTETPAGNIHSVPIEVILPMGGAIAEISVVYNENDGYYHMNSKDGPILYVRINKASSYQAAFSTIIEAGGNIGRYIYDDQGNFIKKEAYNQAFGIYKEVADAQHGVVPLDHDLVYILKSLEGCGWYDVDSPNCIFADDGVYVMPYNAWLFACVYFD